MKKITLLVTLMIMCNCSDQECAELAISMEQRESSPNFMDNERIEMLGDSVILYFETGFRNERLSIRYEDEVIVNDTLVSDEVLEFANSFKVRLASNRTLNIDLNGKCYNVVLPEEFKLYFFNYSDGFDPIEFDNTFPSYY